MRRYLCGEASGGGGAAQKHPQRTDCTPPSATAGAWALPAGNGSDQKVMSLTGCTIYEFP